MYDRVRQLCIWGTPYNKTYVWFFFQIVFDLYLRLNSCWSRKKNSFRFSQKIGKPYYSAEKANEWEKTMQSLLFLTSCNRWRSQNSSILSGFYLFSRKWLGVENDPINSKRSLRPWRSGFAGLWENSGSLWWRCLGKLTAGEFIIARSALVDLSFKKSMQFFKKWRQTGTYTFIILLWI